MTRQEDAVKGVVTVKAKLAEEMGVDCRYGNLTTRGRYDMKPIRVLLGTRMVTAKKKKIQRNNNNHISLVVSKMGHVVSTEG